MRRLILCCLLLASPAAGQTDAGLTRLRLKLNPEFPNWSPGDVVTRCAEHLSTIPAHDRCRIRYFDLSDVPREQLPSGTSALFLGCNSASMAPIVETPRAVPNTDNRIFWIDLSWYRWLPETWEKISAEDPYFREPLIPSNLQSLTYLKTETKANAVIRGSWFIFYTYDTTQFLKKGEVKADDAFYYQLLYGAVERTVTVEEKVTTVKKTTKQVVSYDQYNRQVIRDEVVETPVEEVKKVTKKVKGFIPQTAADFEEIWKVDLKTLKEFPIDQGAVVDEGKSGVSFQNRALWRVRTPLGVYWRTFDVFRSVGAQDFIENPFPNEFDAGEHIVQDAKGAQFYMLTDGEGKRVEFGDPRVVHDTVSGNHVLLTAASCIACHDQGIVPIRNEIPILRDEGVTLYAIDYNRKERLRQFLMGKLNRLIAQDQAEYTEFVKTVNGLTPQESTTQFGRFRAWYASPVTLPQAAREIGCEPQELTKALVIGTKGRLGRLAVNGAPIPRLTWERGGYQEAFLLLLESRKGATIKGSY